MKKYFLALSTLTLFACNPPLEKSTEANKTAQKDSLADKGQKYTIEKYDQDESEMQDSVFKVGKETFTLTVKSYAKGDHIIADTSENLITLYQEEYIDVSINDKTLSIDRSFFKDIYDPATFYHSGFGTPFITKIDKKNKMVIFKVFFGYHNSDAGEMLNFAVTFDGKYEFINVDVISGE